MPITVKPFREIEGRIYRYTGKNSYERGKRGIESEVNVLPGVIKFTSAS